MSIKVRWLSHASFLIETDKAKLLVDPFITDNPLSPVSANEIQTDYIFISHGHGDHVGDSVPIAKQTGAMVVSNYEIQSWISAQGVENVHPLHIGGGYDWPWGRAKLTIAQHGSMLPDGSNGGNPCGFIFYIDDKKIFHACVTGLFYDLKLFGEEGMDLAILPFGDNFTMGPDDALRAVKLIDPKKVVPIHYNTFDVIKQDPQAWAIRVQQETNSEVVVMKPGETIEI